MSSHSSLLTQQSKFSEAALDLAIIELLEHEGYPHVKEDTISREPGQVLLHADLRAFLAKQYAADQITSQEIEAVINQLEAYSAADLYESNKAIMMLVCDSSTVAGKAIFVKHRAK
jgi:type I restriction enzyme R subunit